MTTRAKTDRDVSLLKTFLQRKVEKMEMTMSLHHGRGKDSASCPEVLVKIKGELFYTN